MQDCRLSIGDGRLDKIDNRQSAIPFQVTAYMSVQGRRTDRLGHQLRVELAELISREVKDPRIGFATVTRVELSGDLHHARVLVSVLGSPEEQQSSIEGLSSAAGFLRHEIGHRLALRRAPDLEFILDHGAEAVEKIETLLESVFRQVLAESENILGDDVADHFLEYF